MSQNLKAEAVRKAREDAALNARRLLDKGKYQKAKAYLLESIDKLGAHPYMLAYLAHSLIYSKEYREAADVLDRALEIDEANIEALSARAFLDILEGDVESALKLYFRIQTYSPKHPVATNSIERLRKITNLNNEIPYLKARDFLREPVRRRIPFMLATISASVAMLTIAVAVVMIFLPSIQSALRVETDEMLNSPIKDIYLFEGWSNNSSKIAGYTPKEINKVFLKTKEYISEGKVNKARININRIADSEASAFVKDRFLMLTNFILPPLYTELTDNLEYNEVIKEPSAYRGCYVKWKGIVNEKTKVKNKSVFTVLISKKYSSIEGIVRVEMEGVYSIDQRDMIEIYAEITGYIPEKAMLLLNGIIVARLY